MLLAAFVLLAAVPLIGSVRWLMLMRCQGFDVSFARALHLTLVGVFFNCVGMGHTGGDVIKAYYAARDQARGRRAEAERELQRLLEREPPYPKKVHLADIDPDSALHSHDARRGRWRDLFNKKNRRATILASVPWFLQDLGTYGIGIFTPTILSHTIGHEITNAQNVAGVIARDIAGAKGAALVDTLLIAGILAAVLLADKVGRIKLQVLGFVGCAVGLTLALLQTHADEPLRMLLLFGGFMIFNFMTNLGPNAQTYLLAGEVFPTNIRGKGAGFAAAFAKIGAVLTAFVFPLVLDAAGTAFLLAGLIFTSLLGALVTWWFRIETKGMNLEEIGR
jgi:hypothetical protein